MSVSFGKVQTTGRQCMCRLSDIKDPGNKSGGEEWILFLLLKLMEFTTYKTKTSPAYEPTFWEGYKVYHSDILIL